MSSRYREMLEVLGHHVEDFQSFGSYQGDWIAKLSSGRFVKGSYGSCSGCDGLEAAMNDVRVEVDYSDPEWYEKEQEALAPLREKAMRDFGMAHYGPDNTLSYEEALEAVSENLEWDSDAQEMVDWVKAHANRKLVSIRGKFFTMDGKPLKTVREIVEAMKRDGEIVFQPSLTSSGLKDKR